MKSNKRTRIHCPSCRATYDMGDWECSNCAEYTKEVGRLEAELLEAKRQLEKEKEESLDFCGKGLILEKQFEKLKAELKKLKSENEKARQQGREEAIDFVEQYGGYSLGNYSLLDDWKERIRKLK